jgi:hypothetical protein
MRIKLAKANTHAHTHIHTHTHTLTHADGNQNCKGAGRDGYRNLD